MKRSTVSGCEPARTVVERLGGIAAAAQIAGVDRTTVSKWLTSRDRRGTGGIIPAKHIATLYRHAQQEGLPLSAEDFFCAA